MSSLRHIVASFGWLRQPVQLAAVVLLLALSVGSGVLAQREPVNYRLGIGYADSPYVRNVNTRRLIRPDKGTSIRWLRGESAFYLGGIDASYPLTLSLHTGGGGRRDVEAGRAVTLTVSVNGQPLDPAIRLIAGNPWQRWRVPAGLFADGDFKVELRSSTVQFTELIFWLEGVLADQLWLEPAVDPATIPPFDGLRWGWVLLLAGIVLLVYSYFGGTRLAVAGWLFAVGVAGAGGWLLANNRPLFAAYALTVCAALLLVRLTLPLLTGRPQVGRWLLLLVLASGLLLATPDFQSSDDGLKYLVSESILMRGTTMLPLPQRDLGSRYSRYPLGHSVATLPLLSMGLAWERVGGAAKEVLHLFVLLLDPLVSALAAGLLYLCARRLFDRQVAVALTLIYAFATFAFAYAVQSWTEPLLAMLLLLAFYAMLRVFDPTETRRHRWLLVAGTALGYALFSKEDFVVVAAIFVGWWLLRRVIQQLGRTSPAPTRARRWAGVAWEAVWLVMPIALFFGCNMAYNYLRHDNPLVGGYQYHNIIEFNTPLLTGLYGLLASPGKGLLWYAPPLILSVRAMPHFARRHGWLAGLIGTIFLYTLFFYAVYDYWEGGVCWGPRYFLPILPLLVLPGGVLLQGWAVWRGWQRWGYGLIVGAGGAVALLGVLTHPSDSWNYFYDGAGRYEWEAKAEFEAQNSPIRAAFELVRLGYVQPQSTSHLSYFGFPAVADWLLPAGLLAGAAGAVVQIVRSQKSAVIEG